MKVVNNHPLMNFYYLILSREQGHIHCFPRDDTWRYASPLKTVLETAHEPEMLQWHNANKLAKNGNSMAYMGI